LGFGIGGIASLYPLINQMEYPNPAKPVQAKPKSRFIGEMNIEY
jgi:hypothetical protein